MTLQTLLSPPVDIELWIILFYVAAVLAGARIVEAARPSSFRAGSELWGTGLRIPGSTRRLSVPAGRIFGASQRATG